MYIVNVKKESKTGGENVYECEDNDKQQTDSELNPYECTMFNEF